jgi:hypothetical protein
MWTDAHDEANSRFSQFCERAYKVQHVEVIRMYIRRMKRYCAGLIDKTSLKGFHEDQSHRNACQSNVLMHKFETKDLTSCIASIESTSLLNKYESIC